MNSHHVDTVVDTLFARVQGIGAPERNAVADALKNAGGAYDPLLCAWLFAGGAAGAVGVAARLLHRLEPNGDPGRREDAANDIVDALLESDIHVSGADVVAVLLTASGVSKVFAYAGTSELAMCDAFERLAGVELINGRGDKESAFMAAGASLLRPGTGAAILHGARGLTNAGGALADARRNEVGTVFLVGLASTASSRFLPPHGEPDLIETMAAFARWSWSTPALRAGSDHLAAAETFVAKMREAIAVSRRQPWGPVLFGLPQDLAESRWVPLRALACTPAQPPPHGDGRVPEAAVDLIRSASRPIVLVDDYALRTPGVRAALDTFSRAARAVVVQLRYRRGLMLFERLQGAEVLNFAGWLNPFSDAHRAMLDACDLFITVEDRNIYQRVAGDLPACRKIAVTSFPERARKNEYLGPDDFLLEGDVARVLDEFADRLDPAGAPRGEATDWPLAELRAGSQVNPEPAARDVHAARRDIVGTIAELLGSWANPVIIDDSSMFGGMVTEHYDDLPPGLRVFGGHAGFVGAGLGYAIGLAVAESDARVLCILGDQAFTNSYQALVTAVAQNVRLLIIVCNNGASVSLKKQAAASHGDAPRTYLNNVATFDYTAVAQALGVVAERVEVPIGADPEDTSSAVKNFAASLERCAAVSGPALLELVLPSDPEAWRGIWVVQGFERPGAVNPR